LAGNGFFKWVEWKSLFQMSWLKTSSSNELNGNAYLEWE
jgi:hypothetical protein